MKKPRYLTRIHMYSFEYLKFVKRMKKHGFFENKVGYTNTQRKFAEYLIKREKDISKIGNMESVFNDVRTYLMLKRRSN